MHCHSAVFWLLTCTLIPVLARRAAFETKCKRTCNTVEGSLQCWKDTTDGFAYGLSTAMVDFCQAILKLQVLANETESWYDISRKILVDEIQKYEIDEVRQLSKEDAEQIAVSLLDKCYNASSTVTSTEPSCPSCSDEQTRLLKQWQISAIVLFSVAALFVVIILLLYALYKYHVRRSYASV